MGCVLGIDNWVFFRVLISGMYFGVLISGCVLGIDKWGVFWDIDN